MKNRVKSIPKNPYKKDDIAMLKSIATVFIGFLVISSVMYLFTPYRYCLSTGWSMTPTLEALNVNIVNTRTDNLAVGDIVLAQSPRSGRYITHTIVAIDSNGYLLQGDNEITNPVADGYVPLSAIRGEVASLPVLDQYGRIVFVPVSLGGTTLLIWGLLAFALLACHDIFEHENTRTSPNKSIGFLVVLAVVIYFISVVI